MPRTMFVFCASATTRSDRFGVGVEFGFGCVWIPRDGMDVVSLSRRVAQEDK
jgi:hypothetical protein